jgi:hypothetical protein
MPAKAGIHAFPAESEPCQRRNVPAARPTNYFFGFSKKRRRSRLCNTSANSRRKQKFFCFFFFKKRSAYFDNIGSLVALILFRSAAAEQITKTP